MTRTQGLLVTSNDRGSSWVTWLVYFPIKTNMAGHGKSTMNESMYFLLNLGIFQPAMLVFGSVVVKMRIPSFSHKDHSQLKIFR